MTSDIIAEHTAFIEERVRSLTKAQQRVFSHMRSGCFIMLDWDSHHDPQWTLYDHCLRVVEENVAPSIISHLEPCFVRKVELGEGGSNGAIYTAHDPDNLYAILRIKEQCEKYEKERTVVTPLNKLMVIGYNDVFDQVSWPQIVGPIFRLNEEPEKVLWPPFKIIGNEVHGGAVDFFSRFLELVGMGNCSSIPVPVVAQEGFHLVVDTDLIAYYLPPDHPMVAEAKLGDARAKKALDEIFSRHD